MAEFDMIGHLLGVESQVADMLLGVQADADDRIVKAREEGEILYQRRCDEVRASFKMRLAEEEAGMEASHGTAVEGYRTAVASSQQDAGSFGKLLDGILFA